MAAEYVKTFFDIRLHLASTFWRIYSDPKNLSTFYFLITLSKIKQFQWFFQWFLVC